MVAVHIEPVAKVEVLISVIGSSVGMFLAAIVTFWLFISWRRSGYRFLKALSFFFLMVTVVQFFSTMSSLSVILQSPHAYVTGFHIRQTLFTLALGFVVYSLMRRNNKIAKAISAAEAVEKHP